MLLTTLRVHSHNVILYTETACLVLFHEQAILYCATSVTLQPLPISPSCRLMGTYQRVWYQLLSHGLGLLNKNKMIRLVLPAAFFTHPCLTTAFTDIELYWENSAGDLQLGNLATPDWAKLHPFFAFRVIAPLKDERRQSSVKECTIHILSIVSGSASYQRIYDIYFKYRFRKCMFMCFRVSLRGCTEVYVCLLDCLFVCLCVCVFVCVCVCARADWRSSDLSGEWQKEENGFLRPHNTHRGCLYRPHTKRIYMVTESSPSMYTKSVCLATLPSVLCPRLSTPYDAVALFSWRPCGTLLTRQRFLWHSASSTIFFGTDNSNNRA